MAPGMAPMPPTAATAHAAGHAAGAHRDGQFLPEAAGRGVEFIDRKLMIGCIVFRNVRHSSSPSIC